MCVLSACGYGCARACACACVALSPELLLVFHSILQATRLRFYTTKKPPSVFFSWTCNLAVQLFSLQTFSLFYGVLSNWFVLSVHLSSIKFYISSLFCLYLTVSSQIISLYSTIIVFFLWPEVNHTVIKRTQIMQVFSHKQKKLFFFFWCWCRRRSHTIFPSCGKYQWANISTLLNKWELLQTLLE